MQQANNGFVLCSSILLQMDPRWQWQTARSCQHIVNISCDYHQEGLPHFQFYDTAISAYLEDILLSLARSTAIPSLITDLPNHHAPKIRTPNTMIDIPSSDGVSSKHNHQRKDISSYQTPVSEHIDSLSKSLRVLSLDIHDHPEIRNKEFHAHEILTSFIKEQKGQDWIVTPSAYDIPTAFVAVFDSGGRGPVVSFNAEYGELDVLFLEADSGCVLMARDRCIERTWACLWAQSHRCVVDGCCAGYCTSGGGKETGREGGVVWDAC
jgi:hypothetical protein